jgi:hypothetical protein
MCKKLSIFCLMLAVVTVLNVQARADLLSETNPLKVDMDGESTSLEPGNWQSWLVSRDWSSPISKEFDVGGMPGENPLAELSVYRKAISPYPNTMGGARSREGGLVFVAGTGEYSTDQALKGLGTSYIKLTLSQLEPSEMHVIKLWGWEATGTWSNNTDNPNSKWGFWGTTNPLSWLNANGYSGLNGEPNGYRPLAGNGLTDSNMPGDLYATGDRFFLQWDGGRLGNGIEHYNYGELRVMSSASEDPYGGIITLYGWIDPGSTLGGSMHMPLQGFYVIPEPATVALLGLGGLALMRRRKRS